MQNKSYLAFTGCFYIKKTKENKLNVLYLNPTYKVIVFVHCRIMPGGALEVLFQLLEKKKPTHAYIFTLLSDREYLEYKGKNIPIITALPKRLNEILLPSVKQKKTKKESIAKKILKKIFSFIKIDYRYLMPFFPLLVWILGNKLYHYKYDEIVISSFAVSKNIVFDETKPSLLYLHSPMQYVRTHYKNYIAKRKGLFKIIYTLTSWYIRNRDLRDHGGLKKQKKRKTNQWKGGLDRFDEIWYNSEYTKSCAECIYKKNDKLTGKNNAYTIQIQKVLYPRIEKVFFTTPIVKEKEVCNYFVFIGRVTNLIKEVDKLINLCNETGDNLLILGDGPDKEYCKRIAGPTIIFCGRVTQEKIISILRQSRGLLNITKESFGIATAQALALGVPVFGLAEGGSVELVDEESGILVKDTKPETLFQQFKIFKEKIRNREKIRQKAKKILLQNSL